jgi:hypothetical protein
MISILFLLSWWIGLDGMGFNFVFLIFEGFLVKKKIIFGLAKRF